MQWAAAKDWSISNLRDDNTKVKKLLQLGFSALFFEQSSKPLHEILGQERDPYNYGFWHNPCTLVGWLLYRQSIWSTPKRPPDNRLLHSLKLTANGPESHNFHILRDDSTTLRVILVFILPSSWNLRFWGVFFSVTPLAAGTGLFFFVAPSNPSNSKFNLQTNLTGGKVSSRTKISKIPPPGEEMRHHFYMLRVGCLTWSWFKWV